MIKYILVILLTTLIVLQVISMLDRRRGYGGGWRNGWRGGRGGGYGGGHGGGRPHFDFFDTGEHTDTKAGEISCRDDVCIQTNRKMFVDESFALLDRIHKGVTQLIDHLDATRDSFVNRQFLSEIDRLKERTNVGNIIENSKTNNKYVAVSINKGEYILLNLNNSQSDAGGLVDYDTLMFVVLHELSHVVTEEYHNNPKEQHSLTFYRNYKWLLDSAVEIGIYRPKDFTKEPVQYAGLTIKSNPYYLSVEDAFYNDQKVIEANEQKVTTSVTTSEVVT